MAILDPRVKARIEEGSEHLKYDVSKSQWVNGATQEAERAAVLVEALEKSIEELKRFNAEAPLHLTVVEKPVYITAQEALDQYLEGK